MTLELIKSFEGLSFYGDIPETFNEPEEKVEKYQLQETDWLFLNKGFVDPINRLCDSTLDYGDVDFFNKDKCILMKSWLKDKLKQELTERERCLYSRLLDYTERAISLDTGIVIEL